MIWRMVYMGSDSSGVVQEKAEITAIVNNFKVEKTVGDELFIRSGDITIDTLDPLPLSTLGSVVKDYFALYLNGSIFDIYYVKDRLTFNKKDEKRDRYSTRLSSIQKLVYEAFTDVIVEHSVTFGDWGTGAAAAAVTCEQIRVDRPNDPIKSDTDRWGFSLGDLLANISGTNGNHFSINAVSFPGPLMNSDDLPILYRGTGQDVGAVTAAQAVDATFKDFKTTWIDLFKIASLSFNAFIKVTGTVAEASGTETVSVDIDIIPRIELTAGSTKPAIWLERSRENQKFKVDGVVLTSTFLDDSIFQNVPTFIFSLDKNGTRIWPPIEGGKLFKKNIGVSSPQGFPPDYTVVLYQSWGDFDGVSSKYEIVETDNQMRPYFDSRFLTGPTFPFVDLVGPFYADIITDGDGFSGQISYNGEDLLDQVDIGDEVLQISKISIDRKKKVSIQGIQIA